MPKVRVLTEYCKGCGLCITVCPVEGLEAAEELTALAAHPPKQKADVRCTGCLGCALICPDAAIEIVEVEESCEPQVNRATATR